MGPSSFKAVVATGVSSGDASLGVATAGKSPLRGANKHTRTGGTEDENMLLAHEADEAIEER